MTSRMGVTPLNCTPCWGALRIISSQKETTVEELSKKMKTPKENVYVYLGALKLLDLIDSKKIDNDNTKAYFFKKNFLPAYLLWWKKKPMNMFFATANRFGNEEKLNQKLCEYYNEIKDEQLELSFGVFFEYFGLNKVYF